MLAASLFNVGWAMVQVSHGVFVLDMSKDEHERVVLNSARYAWTVISNILVYGILWLIINVFNDNDVKDQFRWLAYCTLAIGAACTLFFVSGTTEPKHWEQPVSVDEALQSVAADEASDAGTDLLSPKAALMDQHLHYTWRDWLRVPQFYHVGAVYMCTRLMVNVSQVFIPFYILDVLVMEDQAITIAPLLIYVSSFVSTFFMKGLNKRLGRQKTFWLGAILSLCSFVGFRCLLPRSALYVYVNSLLLGFGTSTCMVCSVQLEADLVGENSKSGAFVYGALSFADKLANGIAIFLLQTYKDDAEPSRAAVVYVPAAFLVLAVFFVTRIDMKNGQGEDASKDKESVNAKLLDSDLPTSAH